MNIVIELGSDAQDGVVMFETSARMVEQPVLYKKRTLRDKSVILTRGDIVEPLSERVARDKVAQRTRTQRTRNTRNKKRARVVVDEEELARLLKEATEPFPDRDDALDDYLREFLWCYFFSLLPRALARAWKE